MGFRDRLAGRIYWKVQELLTLLERVGAIPLMERVWTRLSGLVREHRHGQESDPSEPQDKPQQGNKP